MAANRARSTSIEAETTHEECDPRQCPCLEGACALSSYARSVGGDLNGERTLEATEKAVAKRLGGLSIDMTAMAAVSNIYRATNVVRNHMERTVLGPHDLTWTGWVVLWVIWIWGDVESRHVAAEAGITKGTLTGVMNTLIARGLIQRRTHPDDARRALLSLTRRGQHLMAEVFPQFNAEEQRVTADLSADDVLHLARSLRVIVESVEKI